MSKDQTETRLFVVLCTACWIFHGPTWKVGVGSALVDRGAGDVKVEEDEEVELDDVADGPMM